MLRCKHKQQQAHHKLRSCWLLVSPKIFNYGSRQEEPATDKKTGGNQQHHSPARACSVRPPKKAGQQFWPASRRRLTLGSASNTGEERTHPRSKFEAVISRDRELVEVIAKPVGGSYNATCMVARSGIRSRSRSPKRRAARNEDNDNKNNQQDGTKRAAAPVVLQAHSAVIPNHSIYKLSVVYLNHGKEGKSHMTCVR